MSLFKTIFFIFIVAFLLLNSFTNTVLALEDEILITRSDNIDDVIFDGKWTTWPEWKASSLNSINDDVKIRTAHNENFVYIFVDVIHDTSLDIGSDRSIVCFDTNNTKSNVADLDDFCFMGILGKEKGITLNGGSPFASKSNFIQIKNHNDLIIIGNVSDENDRYTKTPHPSYEYKIPTELIDRSNVYGFYLETFDAKSGTSLTWPKNIQKEFPSQIPSPKFWGELISPDKSLPEFPLPMMIMVLIFTSMIILSRKINNNCLRINIL